MPAEEPDVNEVWITIVEIIVLAHNISKHGNSTEQQAMFGIDTLIGLGGWIYVLLSDRQIQILAPSTCPDTHERNPRKE